VAKTMVPLDDPVLARDLAHLSLRLAAYFDSVALEGVDGAAEAAESWTRCAERLKRHLRDDALTG
jgi:hypothetical protein